MKLIAEKLTVHKPTQSGIVLLALVLTPKGCEGSPGLVTIQSAYRSWDKEAAVAEAEALAGIARDMTSGAIDLDKVIATDVDPADWLLCHLQVWETAYPEKAHGMLAGLQGQIDQSALGKKLAVAHAAAFDYGLKVGSRAPAVERAEAAGVLNEYLPALPSLGVATVNAMEVMELVKGVCRGGGTMIMEALFSGQMEEKRPEHELDPTPIVIDDDRGRATVELRWEEEPSGGQVASDPERLAEAAAKSALSAKEITEKLKSEAGSPARSGKDPDGSSAADNADGPPPGGPAEAGGVEVIAEGPGYVVEAEPGVRGMEFTEDQEAQPADWSKATEAEDGPGATIQTADPVPSGSVLSVGAGNIEGPPEDAEVLGVRVDGEPAPIYRHPKRWDEVTEGRKVRFEVGDSDGPACSKSCGWTGDWSETVTDGKGDDIICPRCGASVEMFGWYDGVVLVEKGAIGDFARLFCSEHAVQADVTGLKDFKILEEPAE